MTKKSLIAGGVIVLVAAIGYLIINGSGDSDSGSKSVDVAFATQMVPHHEAAIEMATLAQGKAEHREIVDLAYAIVSTQGYEIKTLNSIRERLEADGIEGENDLQMSDSMMGMDMDMSALENADPFDREFIDQMIPHHQGAIRMAYQELEDGADDETRALAELIIEAQTLEIEQMNRWREDWYGSVSPAGSAPTGPIKDDSSEAESMDHMDH